MHRSRRPSPAPLANAALAAFAPLALALFAPLACGEAGGGAPPDGTGGTGGTGQPPAGSGGTGGVGGTGGAGGSNPAGSAGAGGVAPPDPFATGAELRVPVADGKRSFVRLDPLAVVTPEDPAASTDWDIAFEGYDVYTNGGASGPGEGSSFGPFEPEDFTAVPPPAPPFTLEDKAGGAFLRWYAYGGFPDHQLFSRYHVYGVEDGPSRWKVQILSYSSEVDGAPVNAFYQIRYASMNAQGAGETQTVSVDGTAYATAPDEPKSGCIDLGTGAQIKLTTAEALASTAWHLCFRRDSISVNGEFGGPRGVKAVDFDAAETDSETLEQVRVRTAEGELPRFNDLAFDRFASAVLRGDRVVSAFGTNWLNATTTPPSPELATWLVKASNGTATHLLGFPGFEGATATGPGTIILRAKKAGP